MQNLRFNYLFKKYLDRQCTSVEYDELMLMINNRSNDGILKNLIDEAANNLPDNQLSALKAEAIFNSIVNSDDNAVKQTRFKIRAGWLLAAASILVFGLVAILTLHSRYSGKPVTLARTRLINDHQLIRLSDGSTVTLNKNSRIEYPLNFNANTREVTLIGEGYFDIKHNSHKPFLVHVGGLTVTVLGTAFNVNTNVNGKNIAVTVTRGKVSVSNKSKVLGTLLPNQQISVNKVNQRAQQITVSAQQVVEWQSNDIYFDNVTMDAAMQTLQNRFNTKINFDNEHIKHCTLTGAFTHHESLSQILKVLCSFNNARYDIKANQQILISGPGC